MHHLLLTEQVVAPDVSEYSYISSLHKVQEGDPDNCEYLPISHSWQPVAPCVLVLPAGQLVQLEDGGNVPTKNK